MSRTVITNALIASMQNPAEFALTANSALVIEKDSIASVGPVD